MPSVCFRVREKGSCRIRPFKGGTFMLMPWAIIVGNFQGSETMQRTAMSASRPAIKASPVHRNRKAYNYALEYIERLRPLQCRSHVTIALNHAATFFLLSTPVRIPLLLTCIFLHSLVALPWPMNTTPCSISDPIGYTLPSTIVIPVSVVRTSSVCRLFVLPSCGFCRNWSSRLIIWGVFLVLDATDCYKWSESLYLQVANFWPIFQSYFIVMWMYCFLIYCIFILYWTYYKNVLYHILPCVIEIYLTELSLYWDWIPVLRYSILFLHYDKLIKRESRKSTYSSLRT